MWILKEGILIGMLYMHETFVDKLWRTLHWICENIDDTSGPQIIYTLNLQDTIFALTKGEKQCVAMFLYEPKLLIFETIPDNKIFSKVYKPENLEIFTYINSKFVFRKTYTPK